MDFKYMRVSVWMSTCCCMLVCHACQAGVLWASLTIGSCTSLSEGRRHNPKEGSLTVVVWPCEVWDKV